MLVRVSVSGSDSVRENVWVSDRESVSVDVGGSDRESENKNESESESVGVGVGACVFARARESVHVPWHAFHRLFPHLRTALPPSLSFPFSPPLPHPHPAPL